jgi:hypothetical protein
MFMSLLQNAEANSIRIAKRSFEIGQELKHQGMAGTSRNDVHIIN